MEWKGAIDAVIFESSHVKLSVANFFDRTFWRIWSKFALIIDYMGFCG